MTANESPALIALQAATKDLLYPSESDEPFKAFEWEGNGSARDQVIAHGGAGRRIEEVTADMFFAQLDDSDDADRFCELRRVLQAQLSDLRIFRVGGGEVRVDVYLIGKTTRAALTGLHTVSVET